VAGIAGRSGAQQHRQDGPALHAPRDLQTHSAMLTLMRQMPRTPIPNGCALGCLAAAAVAVLTGCGNGPLSRPVSDDASTSATASVQAPVAVPVAIPPVRPQDVPPAQASAGLPSLQLQVASDGCGVIRTDGGSSAPQGLQWSVSDTEGFEVLGRNATYETHYRFFRPGSYSVVMKAFDGQGYVAISNAVSIVC
jgi:hypothetical protein